MMAKRNYPPGEEAPEDYGQILKDFDDFGVVPKRRSSRRYSTGTRPANFKDSDRHAAKGGGARERASTNGGYKSTAHRSSSSKRISTKGLSSKRSPEEQHKRSLSRGKSLQSEAATTSSDSDLDYEEGTPLETSMNVRNRALIHENRRLQAMVADYERRFILDGQHSESQQTDKLSSASNNANLPPDDDDGHNSEESITKLKGKIRALKTKRKHEKITMIQMKKNVDAHTMEIEGLQRELNRTLTELEKEQRGRQDEKNQYRSVSKQLAEARSQLNKTVDLGVVEDLKSDLQKRDGELEVTLELLQSKVERIIQLEYEVEKSNEKLAKAERRVEDLMKNNQQGGGNGTFQSMELISAEAEIKSMRRQNMMLKLVVEELQEARKRRSDSDIDIDSVFLKLPPEIQQEIPFSVGLGALSLAGDNGDNGSVDTDMYSLDTSKMSMSDLPRKDPHHPLLR